MSSFRHAAAVATSAALFVLTLSLALATRVTAQSPGRRVAVAGTSMSYPYTVEIPSDWQVHEGGFPKRTLWLAPPGVLNPDLDPDAIGVIACTISLANPEQVAANTMLIYS